MPRLLPFSGQPVTPERSGALLCAKRCPSVAMKLTPPSLRASMKIPLR